jgi:hypothetical protein
MESTSKNGKHFMASLLVECFVDNGEEAPRLQEL